MEGFFDLLYKFGQSVGNAFDRINNSNNQAMVEQASNDRLFNAQREDTQYQRLVEDLDKAGLNKWLAVNGSASPSAQMVSATSEQMSRARELGNKYYQLFESAVDHTLQNSNRMWKNSNDLLGMILKAGMTFAG